MEHVDLTMGVIIPYVNFFTFFIAAIILFKKPVSLAAQKALATFDKFSLDAAEEKKAAEERLRLLKEKFSSIDQEIFAMKKVAEEAARVEEKDIIAEGRRLAAHVKEETKRVFEAEVEKVRESISYEILEIVKSEVAQKVKKEVSEADQHKIISSQLSHLKAVQAIS